MNSDSPINTDPPVTDVICGICGEAHKYSNCSLVEIKKHVPDNVIPPKAKLTLPKCVRLETMADGSYSIIANSFIEKGTQFGPLEAQKLLTLNPSIIFPLKLFNYKLEDLSEYYLDTGDENHCNWMIFVTPAQTEEEQNLICFQDKSKVHYVAIKDIEVGNFLKVWYSPYYAKRMKKNILTTQNHLEPEEPIVMQPIDINELMKKQQNLMERNNWICKFCGKIIAEVSLFANHILEHYQRKMGHCDICKKSFRNQRNLRRHIKTIHMKEAVNLTKKQKMDEVPNNQLENKEMRVGGPLLNDLLTDSLDNTNLMSNLELNQFSLTLTNSLENQNMLLESDSLSLNVDNLITENVKQLDHFNFEIDETQEEHVCDVCLKVFSKVSNLIQHLKKHTGKYTCRYCLKIFSRHENLKSHRCNSDKTPTFNCSLCPRSFMLRKYLVRHVTAIHDNQYTCDECNRPYYSRKEYQEHNCSAVPNQQKTIFTCPTCSKEFYRELYLKRHMVTHTYREKSIVNTQFICEICAQQFATRKGLGLHKTVHFDRTLPCKICHKKFYRQDVLKTHMATHEEATETCSICNMKFKSKQILANHMRIHTGVKPYQCNKCPQAFYQQSSLTSHCSKVHSKKCTDCNKSFETTELLKKHKHEHTMKEYFECPLCKKYFKLRSSLRRHLKQSHSSCDSNTVMLKVNAKHVDFMENSKTSNMDNLFNDDMLCATENTNNDNIACSTISTINDNDLLCSIESNTNNNELCSNQSYNISDIVANVNEDNAVLQPEPEPDNDSFENIVNNFESIMNGYDSNDAASLLPASYDQLGENTSHERILDFNDLEIDIDSNFGLQQNTNENNREVCLSMPDLMEIDQEITLGENAYMLDDGTIVEPKDQGNVLVYILGK